MTNEDGGGKVSHSPFYLADSRNFGALEGFPPSGGSSNHSNYGGYGNFHLNGRESDFGLGNSGSSRNIMGLNSGRNPSGGNLPLQMQMPPLVNGERGRDNSIDQLQHQFRQMGFEKQHNFMSGTGSSSTSQKDWQDGFRALLPNVNVSFGALPHQQNQLPHHLLDGVLDSGSSSRFNNLSTNSSNMLNDPHQNSTNNHHTHMSQVERSHHMQQSMRQNSGTLFFDFFIQKLMALTK